MTFLSRRLKSIKKCVILQNRKLENREVKIKGVCKMNVDIDEVKLEIYTPEEYIKELRDTLTRIGACKVGEYDHVVSYQETKGFWKPLAGSHPFNGEKEEINSGMETKMEVRCPIEKVNEAMEVIRKIHPYEEPVINVIPLLNHLFEQ